MINKYKLQSLEKRGYEWQIKFSGINYNFTVYRGNEIVLNVSKPTAKGLIEKSEELINEIIK